MKPYFSIILFLSLVIISIGQERKLLINYLNQKEPSYEAEIFAPGIISLEDAQEYPPSFSNNFSEVYFGSRKKNASAKLYKIEKSPEGVWNKPVEVSFTGFPEAEALLSADNSRLFFAAHNDMSKAKIHEIWYAEREANGFTGALKLYENAPFIDYEYFASESLNGHLYFSREGVIMHAQRKASGYTDADTVLMPGHENSFISHPFIAPDHSFLLFDSRKKGGYGSADLYISFYENGSWSTPKNLGKNTNSPHWDAMPVLCPDGNYLFFCRNIAHERDVYWQKFDVTRYLD